MADHCNAWLTRRLRYCKYPPEEGGYCKLHARLGERERIYRKWRQEQYAVVGLEDQIREVDKRIVRVACRTVHHDIRLALRRLVKERDSLVCDLRNAKRRRARARKPMGEAHPWSYLNRGRSIIDPSAIPGGPQ